MEAGEETWCLTLSYPINFEIQETNETELFDCNEVYRFDCCRYVEKVADKVAGRRVETSAY